MTKKTILLIDDQDRFLQALQKSLETQGYAVDPSNNAAEAIRQLGTKTYDAIICDVQMPGMGGFEFLQKSRELNGPPVILMTGFKELADADRATREGARGFIAKPFRPDEIRKLLEEVMRPPEPPSESVNLDDEFFPLLISEFLSGKKIQYDIYIRFNASKYLKIAHGGDDLDPTRVAKFVEKGLRILYLRKEDYKRYVAFLINLSTRVADQNNIDHQKKMKMLKVAGEVALRGMYEGKLSEPELGEAKMIVHSMHRIVCEDETLCDLLAALKDSGDALYVHAMSVSLIAVRLAHALKWTSQGAVMSVGLAGFFHDIGKKEFPKSMLEKPRIRYTPDEVALHETHPVRGANLLGSVPRFPSEVVQAVLQHHEACSGVGFPKHLTKSKIIPIARIIAIADEFSKGMMPGPDCLEISPREMYERMKTLKADSFDAEYLKAFESVLTPST
jgi:putative nucleotidyltransferase with HDIG domain